MNAAIAASEGPFVCLLDADDTMPPDRASAQVAFLEDRPDLAGVSGRQHLVVEEDAPPPTWVIDPTLILDEPEGAPELSPSSPLDPFFPFGAITLRREAFERIGGFDTDLPIAYDVDWILRAWEGGLRLATMDHVTLMRRAHGGNLTYDLPAQRIALARVLKKRVDRNRERAAG
jgi:GT2 family glycosyltransferase